jgi:hypothetical protein
MYDACAQQLLRQHSTVYTDKKEKEIFLIDKAGRWRAAAPCTMPKQHNSASALYTDKKENENFLISVS